MSELRKELRRCADAMEKAKEKGNDSEWSIANSEYYRIVDEISKVRGEIKETRKQIQAEKQQEESKTNDQKRIEMKDDDQKRIEMNDDDKKRIEMKDDDQKRIEMKDENQKRIEMKDDDQKRIEMKDDPVPDRNIEDPKPEPDKSIAEIPEISIEKTGLEIFREQFNKKDGPMSQLKAIHGLSENPFLKLPIAVAPAAATLAITGGVAALPVLGAVGAGAVLYGLSKPILKRITGQAKKEKAIQEQFESMSPEEFDKMAKFLSEEVIISLKPHCAILNAFQKAAKTRYGEELKDEQENRANLEARCREILEQETRDDGDNVELNFLNSEIEKIDNRIDEIVKIQKEIKRGTQRKSADYQGNLKGSKLMNLFGRRNHGSKVYGKGLNEYADRDRARVEEEAFAKYEESRGNIEAANERYANAAMFNFQKRDVLGSFSYTRFGVHLGPLNAGINNTTARIVSDQHDRKIETAGALATVGAGVYRTIQTMNQNIAAVEHNAERATDIASQHNAQVAQNQQQIHGIGNVKFSDTDMKYATAAEAAARANAGEATNLHSNRIISHTNSAYVTADAQVNAAATNDLNYGKGMNTSAMSIPQKLRALASNMRSTAIAEDATAKSMQGLQTASGVSHVDQGTLMGMAKTGKETEAGLIEQLADIIDKSNQFNPGQKIGANVVGHVKDFLGPIMTAVGSFFGIESLANKARKESRWTKRQRDDFDQNI